MSSRVQKCRFENETYFQFLLVIEVEHTHMDIRTRIPARCWHVLEEARRSICHLQHLRERSTGNMGPLFTKISSLNTDALQQTGHWEQKLVEGSRKKNPGRQNSLFPPPPSPISRISRGVKISPPSTALSLAALLLWSGFEGHSYYWHRAQVRMASRQHTIKA